MSERICYYCAFLTKIKLDEHFRWMTHGHISLPVCCNHPDSPGVVREIHPGSQACRNFCPRKQIVRVEPPQPTDPGIRHIPLTRGLYAIVDAADYGWLSKYKWFAHGSRGGICAARGEKGRIILMHREIMQPPPGMVVDHIDHNRLNDRRSNMRNCTTPQNARNKRMRGSQSGYIGVYPDGKQWEVRVTCDGKKHRLGPFADKVEAARARDRLARKLFGEFAYLNFPDWKEAAGTDDANRADRPGRYIDCRGSITAHAWAVAKLSSRPACKRARVASR